MDARAFSMTQAIENEETPKSKFGVSSKKWPSRAIFGQFRSKSHRRKQNPWHPPMPHPDFDQTERMDAEHAEPVPVSDKPPGKTISTAKSQPEGGAQGFAP